MLDQDSNVMADIDTFGWLIGFANRIIDEEEEAERKLKQRR